MSKFGRYRAAKPGDGFCYGGRWYAIDKVTKKGFQGTDAYGFGATFTFKELEDDEDWWRVKHLCNDACTMRGQEILGGALTH